ncbi:MAG TPA: cupredoxin family copper-binding protein [Steroidobacteraceae bacterium]|jgi:plastocyanin|nr:cupredoxin family copper-binding protein [Steroidobacteraceae bacterium]
MRDTPSTPVGLVTRLAAVAVGVLALAGERATPLAATPDPAAVVIARGFMFAPVSLTVAAGSTVSWVNKDDEPHTVVSDSGLFRSGAMDTNQSFAFRFDRPGTYRYACSIHPRMTGTIIVR